MDKLTAKNSAVRSMTGFGTAVCNKNNYTISVEIKSVNNRYKDVAAHLPPGLRALEVIINDYLNKYSLRGKIDVYVNFTDTSGTNSIIKVDKNLLLAYKKALDEIARTLCQPTQYNFSSNDFIALSVYPGILTKEDILPTVAEIKDDFINTLGEALTLFIEMKTTEGKNLCSDILYRLAIIRDKVTLLCDLAPSIIEKYRQNLVTTLGEYLNANDIDQTRIIQETAIYAEKTNYTEETTRLQSHLQQFEQTLSTGGSIGRKLDFIVQEMNREINTIASKANSAQAGQLVVDVKGEIEKIREQIQNIE